MDVCFCFFDDDRIENCHILAILVRERQTGENICENISKILEAVARPAWKDCIIGISTYDAA